MFGEEEFMLNDFEENGMAYGDVFDKIEDLLDFSSEEMQMLMEPEPLTFDDAALPVASGFPPPATEAPPPVKAPPPATSVADDDNFPCEEDEAELEWLSNFVEESFSPTNIVIPKTNNSPTNGTAQNNGPEPKSEFHYNRTPSPVSVLEDKLAGGGVDAGGPAAGGARRRRGGSLTSSSSSTSSSPTSSSSGCSSGVANGVTALASAFNPPDTVAAVRGRAPRTKRPRPPPAVRSNILGPIEDSLLMVPSIVCSDVDNFADSIPHNPFDHHHAPADDNSETTTDKKKKKLKIVSSASVHREAENSRPTNFAAAAAGAPVRKCMHCEIQKTPQWRAGPMGPKTLCNACGVRYKSGRLFPEYRPAASPTFVPTHHSNSHKKVVEMRVKSSSGKDSMSEVPSSLPVSARGCELLHYIRSC